jgi:hypothetical protein
LSSCIPSYSISFSSWCSASFVYPFISISMGSFQYHNLTCFFVISFLVFVLSIPWERPPKDLHLFASIHGWWLGDIIGETHNYSTPFRCKCNNMNHTCLFGIVFWIILFLEYSTKSFNF